MRAVDASNSNLSLLLQRFYNNANASSDLIAIHYGDQSITYANLLQRVEHYAKKIAFFGLTRADRTPICLVGDDKFMLVVLQLAVLRAGLLQLNQAGVFDEIAGVIIGQFEYCVSHDPDRDGTVDDVIDEWSSRFRVPCLKDFPYGHGDRRCILPIGKNIKLDVDARSVIVQSRELNK